MDEGLYKGKGMGSENNGGAEQKGILYPHRSTSTTQYSAPLSLHACQWSDKQPRLLGDRGMIPTSENPYGYSEKETRPCHRDPT